MSVAAAQLMMRSCVIIVLVASGCASSPPAAPALEVDSSSSSADVTTPSILERAQAMASASCAPSRAEMASPVEEALQERLQRNARWRGADAAKDRAVDDNVSALLKRTLTMKSAVEIALVRNPAVQVAYESLGLAQADLVDAGLLDNPRLDLSLKAPVADPTGTAAPELGVGVELPFLSVLFIAQRTSIAEARRDAARARVGAGSVACGVG